MNGLFVGVCVGNFGGCWCCLLVVFVVDGEMVCYCSWEVVCGEGLGFFDG